MRKEESREWVIVGIGNPGREYEKTRHNLGFEIVRALASKLKMSLRYEHRFKGEVARANVEGHTVHLLLPTTYVNLSGEALRLYLDYYKLKSEHVVVVVDDVALPFGELRVRVVGSSGGHNGLKSIQAHLGTTHYARLRLGIGSAEGKALTDHVLGHFSQEENALLDTLIEQAVAALMRLFESNLTRVMNEVNKKKPPSNGAGEQE